MPGAIPAGHFRCQVRLEDTIPSVLYRGRHTGRPWINRMPRNWRVCSCMHGRCGACTRWAQHPGNACVVHQYNTAVDAAKSQLQACQGRLLRRCLNRAREDFDRCGETRNGRLGNTTQTKNSALHHSGCVTRLGSPPVVLVCWTWCPLAEICRCVALTSSDRSATSRFSFPFSSRSCRSSRSSLSPSPAYRFFHTYKVAWLIPCSRHTSAALPPSSTCRSVRKISSSPCSFQCRRLPSHLTQVTPPCGVLCPALRARSSASPWPTTPWPASAPARRTWSKRRTARTVWAAP